jgi:hypothetical protein
VIAGYLPRAVLWNELAQRQGDRRLRAPPWVRTFNWPAEVRAKCPPPVKQIAITLRELNSRGLAASRSVSSRR